MMDDDDDFFGSLGGGGSGGEMGMGMNMHVTLLRIGQTPDPKLGVALYIDPEVTLQTFLKKAAERLNVNEARQVLNVDGDVVDDFVLVNNREALYIVTDEDQDVNGTGLAQETARCDENGDALLGSDDNASETGTIGCGASQERVGSYILGKFLGSGSFGKVHIGTHIMTHEKVALKFLSKNQMGSTQDAERVFTEIQCLNSLDHPNVIKLLHVIQTPDDMVLALEFASGGDLKEVVEEGPLEEDLASRIFVQILEGVTYCHRHHIIHYDLKLENILLAETQDPHLALHATDPVVEPTTGRNIPSRVDESIGDHHDPSAASNETAGDGQSIGTEDPLAARRKRLLGLQVKITDFGLSQLCNPGQTSEYTAGSLAYIAPEVFAAGETAGPPRDVWALGVILFTMVCGRLPFSGSTFQEVSEKIRRGTYSWESADASVSESFKQLIAGMLNTNPEERMTVSEVRLMSWIDRGRKTAVKQLEFFRERQTPSNRSALGAKTIDKWK
ncbi:Protein kinase, putative [Hondaea fermentalgiana]|uniref:Protein kinase, putative n=1 Tax=Hondaea fermentalgiana TaxID=2315210 RepID=A0A2R5GA71_9STRA|nr:Protein kinase, putative [Hondaea fermentalgiana]|eukprot:GBG27917.1 Protein kinase, putative [Hondaea fermentalgiana]